MPSVRYPSVLRAVYEEVSGLIAARQVPTELVMGDPDIYRAFDSDYFVLRTTGVFPRSEANKALIIRDENVDTNRFSGQSLCGNVPARGGLYCTFGQPALVGELLHYARINKDGLINRNISRDAKTGFPNVDAALDKKCIIRIRLMSSLMALDLSEHNPGSRQFVSVIEKSARVQSAINMAHASAKGLWDWIFDGWDYTIARGIGLAVGASDHLQALRVRSARHAERSIDETGDNIIFFGRNGEQVPNLSVKEAYMFPLQGKPEFYPVEF